MKKRIFIDTNIFLSGVFFSGNEAKLLSLMDVDLLTSDLVIEEAKEVARRKFEAFGVETCRVALDEIDSAAMDFNEIIQVKQYHKNIAPAKELISKEKDSRILAAVLTVKPDYFVTGDSDFFKPEIKKLVNVCKTREVLTYIGI